jgi:hypothetical protein
MQLLPDELCQPFATWDQPVSPETRDHASSAMPVTQNNLRFHPKRTNVSIKDKAREYEEGYNPRAVD